MKKLTAVLTIFFMLGAANIFADSMSDLSAAQQKLNQERISFSFARTLIIILIEQAITDSGRKCYRNSSAADNIFVEKVFRQYLIQHGRVLPGTREEISSQQTKTKLKNIIEEEAKAEKDDFTERLATAVGDSLAAEYIKVLQQYLRDTRDEKIAEWRFMDNKGFKYAVKGLKTVNSSLDPKKGYTYREESAVVNGVLAAYDMYDDDYVTIDKIRGEYYMYSFSKKDLKDPSAIASYKIDTFDGKAFKRELQTKGMEK